ncbi:glycosyl hydrolase family 28-related protein [uncultured Clostridium sp.]|uniref:LPXTG cell wall anchor domain-containing protein n=1 Tax=uncultured Clostridium sp. TaxID=59620 RepID=UPI003439A8EA
MGDGVTDNTENLKKLIEYAASHGRELYFPAGVYKIAEDIDLSTINLPALSNFTLSGDKDGNITVAERIIIVEENENNSTNNKPNNDKDTSNNDKDISKNEINNSKNPSTSDKSNILTLSLIGMASIAGILFINRKKKKNK